MIYQNQSDFIMDEETVVTFGKFDGIHKGHQMLIQKTVELAKERGMKSVVCTFDMRGWTRNEGEPKKFLTSVSERMHLCEEMGVDCLIEYPFDDRIADMTSLSFIEEIIKNKLHAAVVVVGADWHFGKDREGDCTLLKASQKLYRFEAVVLEKKVYEGREISSTWIREEVLAGRMENANILLGYPYAFRGEVVHGNAIGRQIDCPTVNLKPQEDKLLPPFGVYASKISFEDKTYYGVTNVGIKPTVTDQQEVTVETYILNYDGELYGKELCVSLMHYERPEMKFDNIDRLQVQLANDISFAKLYFMLENT